MKMRPVAHAVLMTALLSSVGTTARVSAQAAGAGGSTSPASARSAPDGSDANSARAEAAERLALRIMQTPVYKEAVAKALKDFQANEYASKPEFLRHVKSAADEAGTFAAIFAAMGAVPDPVFTWFAATPRKWHGYTLPGSRWFADNTDTFYRATRVDDKSSYEITVQVGKTLPAQLSFLTYDWLMLETGAGAQNDVPLTSLEITDATKRNADGSITLTAGPGPAKGRLNYLELKPGARQIFVREIRGDGSLPPVRLAVTRTSGKAPVSKSLDEVAKEATRLLAAGVVATNNVTKVFGALAENQLGPVRVRWAEGVGPTEKKMITDELLGPDKAVGFISSGLFNLKDDEALILTLKPMGTRYVGINTYRPFLVSPEHVYGSSSLNNFQSKANPDGSFTFVLSRKDPGVYNWLDVGGIPFGYIAVRWQTLTHPVAGTAKNGIGLVKTVKLADLRRELPPTTKWVTAAERAEQRATRARLFMLRCLGTPCEVGGALDKPY